MDEAARMSAAAPHSFAPPEHVLVRAIAARYASCLRSDPVEIDVARARSQHAGYVAAIRALGIAVSEIDPDDDCPDACFVEDTAVITGRHAVLTRPGAEPRRAELPAVERALSRRLQVHRMTAPAMLDGGDVLRVGAHLFVGLSTRTNREGAAWLAEVARLDGLDVTALPVRGGLHLKSALSLATDRLLVHAPEVSDDLDPLRAVGLTCLAAPEPAGANVLALGRATLVSADAPETARALEARGLTVQRVPLSEIHKGDGALTCLSLRLPRAGHWAT